MSWVLGVFYHDDPDELDALEELQKDAKRNGNRNLVVPRSG